MVGDGVSLSKFLSTGAVEVFCPASEYIDFRWVRGCRLSSRKDFSPGGGRLLDPERVL